MKKVFNSLFIIILCAIVYISSTAFYVVNTTALAQDNISRGAWQFDTLVSDTKVHIDRDENKQAMSLNIYYLYPVAAPHGVDIRKLEYTFMQLFSGKQKPAQITSEAFDNINIDYTQQALEYGKKWETEKEEFPDLIDFTTYYIEKFNSINATSKYCISISIGQGLYLGGVHGSFYISYYNIDLRNSQVIEEEELFKTGYENSLAKMIQNAVEERNSSPDKDEHIMLLVEIPDIKPNGNFYFAQDGLTYIYNQYEISPYAQGPVEITIPYDEIIPLLNNRFLEIIENI